MRGLTLEQVGDYIGVKKTTIQRYETEEIDIKRTAAIKLAEILNTNPSYIMGWTDCQAPDGEMYSPMETELVHAYRKATPDEQGAVDLILKKYKAAPSRSKLA